MFTLLLVLQASPAAPANTPPPAHDALHYNIRLEVPQSGRGIAAEVATHWRLLSSAPIRVELDSALRVGQVWLQQRLVTNWRGEGDVLLLPHGGHAGDTVVTVIHYEGVPRDGLIIRDSAGTRTIFADNWPNRAHRWFPSQDHPSDKATVSFEITAPDGLEVIANGELQGSTYRRSPGTRWVFRMERPIPVYTMVVGIAEMSKTSVGVGGCSVRCVPVEVWSYPADLAYAVTGPFRRAAEMIDHFTALVGEFPYSRLSHVQSTTIFGGMENSTVIFYADRAYRRRSLDESTVAHETAHQWFGDAVTEREWPHLWLSEGFATYFAALWEEHLGGDSALQATMRGAAQGIVHSEATNRPIIAGADNLLKLLNTNNYNKGAWVLHSLRGLVGDATFFKGIREYYRRYRDSTVLSADFQAVMEAASGKELGWYFRQALHQPGYPKLEIRSSYDSTKSTLELTIRQTQSDAWGFYHLPGFELLIDGMLVRVDLEARESKFTFDQFTKPVTLIEPDPSGWWLAETAVTSER